MGEAADLLVQVAFGEVSLEAYLQKFGHRAVCDYEVSEPRFSENPGKLSGILTALRQSDRKKSNTTSREAEIQAWASTLGQLSQKLFMENWHYLKIYESLKETAKHHLLFELALLRKILLTMSERKGVDLFYLKADEVWGLEKVCQVEFWKALVSRRKAEREIFESVVLPPQVGVNELEGWQINEGAAHSEGDLQGLCVSGSKMVEGSARVLKSIEDLCYFQPGEILVAKFTEPSWSPVFKMAKGIVTEIGGALSHTSILAREYKLTAIVSARSATDRIKTGDEIVLTLDGVVRRKADR